MNRRGVLKGLGVAAAASMWPGWLREAFAGEKPPCGVLRGAGTLAAALQRAHEAFKPLLVLAIPTDNGAKWDRGRHLGEWLNHGSDRDLAALACAEVVCARMDAVRQLFPSAPSGEPAMLLAHVDRSPARLGIVLQAFEEHEPAAWQRPDREDLDSLADEDKERYWAEYHKRRLADDDASVQPCIDRTGAAIREAVLGDAVQLQHRADGLWERLGAGDRQAAEQVLGGRELPAQPGILAVAPLLAAAAAKDRMVEKRMTQLLADAARAAYSQQRIPGSKWAVSSGCGTIVEGDETDVAFGCGMGHVPRKSERFLYFFSKPPYSGAEE
jgi:hypothetical protein